MKIDISSFHPFTTLILKLYKKNAFIALNVLLLVFKMLNLQFNSRTTFRNMDSCYWRLLLLVLDRSCWRVNKLHPVILCDSVRPSSLWCVVEIKTAALTSPLLAADANCRIIGPHFK